MPVELTPAEFTMVSFDPQRVREIATEVATELGLDDRTIEITVDETSPLGFTRLDSIDPIRLHVEGGAIENARRPRHLNEAGCREVMGRLLLEAKDRLDPSFGAPEPEAEIPAAARVAWDTYIVGRLVRTGGRDEQQRRRYHFRVRHGFDDRADAAFDRLWNADGLTFDQLVDS